MFRRFPIYQRLITWSKPHAVASRTTRAYEWFDWNSLLADEVEHRALVPSFMDGSSYFPSRPEMERGITAFVQRTGVSFRYGCRWYATRREANGFVLETSEGEYTCRVMILAVGMAQPWKPRIEGIEAVPHYVEVKPIEQYVDKRVFLIGKRNSAFELADGLLPHARQIILASPRPARISVLTHSTAAARARYLQPYEDHVLGGGNVVLDASIERIQRTDEGFRVFAKGTTRSGDLVIDVDDVVAATGFQVPLGDLRNLGVATFAQDRLPAQTPYWESATVPGVYFAGAITQGAIGMKKYGIPSNSAAVHGFRYNARVLARHVGEKHFGLKIDRDPVEASAVLDHLLGEAVSGPELRNQQSYLARVVEFSEDHGIVDDGVVPLAHFVDAPGPDAVAITLETDADGDIHPAVYVRRGGSVDEHVLPSHPLHDFNTREHKSQLASILKPLLVKE
jgi:thioredoxin reductase